MEPHAEDAGLNTKDALNQLYVEIEGVLQQYKLSQRSRYALVISINLRYLS